MRGRPTQLLGNSLKYAVESNYLLLVITTTDYKLLLTSTNYYELLNTSYSIHPQNKTKCMLVQYYRHPPRPGCRSPKSSFHVGGLV